MATGRPDSVYSNVVVEYKDPGTLSAGRDAANNKKLIEQIRQRFYDMRREENRAMNSMFGVGTDGKYFVFVRFRDELREMGPGYFPIGAVAYRLLRQWLGAAHENIEIELGAKLVAVTLKTLPEFADLWEKTNVAFQLVEGDSQFEIEDVVSSLTNSARPRVFAVGDEEAVLEYVTKVFRSNAYEATGSLTLRGKGWAFCEVLADALAFQPNVLMFCINCHLCCRINGVDIPTLLFRQFPNSKHLWGLIGVSFLKSSEERG